MRPKGKLFALFAVFAAIGLVTASGAFTTVQADRTAEVNVAGDANALLGISANDNTTDGSVDGTEYVDTDNDQVVIDFDGTDDDTIGDSANGLNGNATTNFTNVLNITNQGTQPVDVTVDVSVDSNSADYGNGTVVDDAELLNSILIEDGDGNDLKTSSSNSVGTGVDEEITIKVDLTDEHGVTIASGDFSLTITIVADGT